MPKAVVRIKVGSSPIDTLAVSASLTARIALPQAPSLNRANARTDSAVSATVRNPMPFSPISAPKMVGLGMPDSPFQPPVKSCHSAADTADGERRPERPLPRGGQDAHGVGTDGIERHMPKRNLTAQPNEDVEAGADDRGQSEGDDEEILIAIAANDKEACGGDHDRGCHGCAPAHTFLNAARPNRPLGRKARAMMTSVNVTIWV